MISLEPVKHILIQQWILPLKFPNFFVGDRRPWDSLLLYGLAGTGKTTLAKVFAAEIGAPFIRVIGHKLRTEDYGESETAVKNLFKLAKENAPSVLFIDEVEGLFPNAARGDHSLTSRICNEFFNQIELLAQGPKSVIIMAATSKPNRMDKGALNKFEKVVYMEPPTSADRAHIFLKHLATTEHLLTHRDIETLGRRTAGYTGGDILRVIRNARLKPLSELASAFHFKKIDAPSKMEDGGLKCYWTACNAKDGLGMQMTWRDIPNADDLVIPKLTMNRMLQAVLRVKPSSTGISTDKIIAFRRGLLNEYIIHEADEDRETSLNHLRESRKWYDCFLECFVG